MRRLITKKPASQMTHPATPCRAVYQVFCTKYYCLRVTRRNMFLTLAFFMAWDLSWVPCKRGVTLNITGRVKNLERVLRRRARESRRHVVEVCPAGKIFRRYTVFAYLALRTHTSRKSLVPCQASLCSPCMMHGNSCRAFLVGFGDTNANAFFFHLLSSRGTTRHLSCLKRESRLTLVFSSAYASAEGNRSISKPNPYTRAAHLSLARPLRNTRTHVP